MLFSNSIVAAIALLSPLVSADKPPTYSNFTRVWSDGFTGTKGLPSTNNWNIISTASPFNNEWQTYTTSTKNVYVTGAGRSGKLQLIPRSDKTAVRGWTSGRLESVYTFTPTPGKVTRLESVLRIAGAPASQKQGIWPAFWLNGQSYREGTKWPASGEIDIFENVNGDGQCVGVVHCDVAPGGVCNEPIGLAARTTINGHSFSNWRVEFDLRKTGYKDQTITWFKDDVKFHQITGKQLNNEKIWKTLAAQPLYIILNVAVGGDFPGAPNSKTVGGNGNMMEVSYVSHYVSK